MQGFSGRGFTTASLRVPRACNLQLHSAREKCPGGRRMIQTKETQQEERVVRIGALADLHCSKSSRGQFQPLLMQAAEAADVLLLGGDLTDYGLPEEAEVLAGELSGVKVPVIAVLGN